MIYRKRVKDELDQSWSEWLGNIQITSEKLEDGSLITTLTEDTVDQSALFGILDRIRDLNIFLILVIKDGQEI